MDIPRQLYRAAQVRRIEADAFAGGASGAGLMLRAARAAQLLLQRRWPQARCVVVLCGGGNNGGDGLVLARLLREQGLGVQVLAAFVPGRLRGEAAQAWAQLQGSGVAVQDAGVDADVRKSLALADVVVDALLGIGVRAPLSAETRALVTVVNEAGRPVLALDLPSGLDPDRGIALPAVRATATLTFVAVKQGLVLGDGPDHCGVLHFDDLGVASTLEPALRRIDAADVAPLLGRRPRSAHKAQFGRVLVVGGGEGMPGAARLAGEAALRVGAGLVTVASLPQHAAAIVAPRPELMFHGVADAAALTGLLPRFDVVALGPGLGQQPWARAVFETVVAAAVPGQRLVMDADALNLLSLRREVLRREDWVLTPHPGEAARLLGSDTARVQQDRCAALDALVRRHGGIAVLKGAGTLVGGAAPVPWICDRGNPGMAVPGMGDVLTGAVAGLLAQQAGQPQRALQAVAGAVFIHATAGDECAAAGERGVLALEVATRLRGVMAGMAS